MNQVDPRTVILLSGVMGGLMSLVLFFLQRNFPNTIKGLREWAWALFVLFCAGVLASLRDLAPVWISNVIPNLLIGSGTYLAYLGSQRFFGQTVRAKVHLALIALVNLALLWFTVVTPSYPTRILLLTPLLIYLIGMHAALLLRQGQGRFSHRFVAAVLCLATLNEVVRLATALTMSVGDTLFDRQPQNLVHITAYPFLMLLMAIGMVLLATDRLREELEYLATHDALTNALTRRHMNQACAKEIERCRRHGRNMAVLAMDLDHFKDINDAHGHQAGDQVLIRFVDCANAMLRRGDELGRFGGEEFVALLPETTLPEAMLVAERIRAGCETQATAHRCTVSIGVATCRPESDTLDQLLARADAAMYRAKANGRNRVESA